MSRSTSWAAAGAVGVAVAVGWFAFSDQEAVDVAGPPAVQPSVSSRPTPDVSAASTSAAELSQVDADELAADLVSGDPRSLTSAVVLPDGQGLDPALLGSLQGMNLQIDAGTFTATSPETGEVAATSTTRGQDQTWSVELLRVDGQWKVLWTAPRAS